jgi:hypothetical protein
MLLLHKKGVYMDLIFVGVIGIFSGITWLLIEGVDML